MNFFDQYQRNLINMELKYRELIKKINQLDIRIKNIELAIKNKNNKISNNENNDLYII